MRRRPLFALLVLICALVLGACNSSVTAQAARVNGTPISEQTLDQALSGLSSPAFACIASGGGQKPIHGAGGSSTYSSAISAELLTAFIQSDLLSAAVHKEGLSLTPLGRQLATTELTDQLTPASGSTCTSSGQAALSAMPPAFRASFVELAEARTELAAHFAGVKLTPSAVKAYAASHPSVSQLYCISAIVTSTEPAAISLVQAARSGASFADLAKAHSIDTSSAPNGGALGCAPASALATALKSAVLSMSVGQVSTPISFDGSWVILELTSFRQASAEDVASVIVQNGDTKVATFFSALQKSADVEVDARYGTWKLASGAWGVSPPSGPGAKYLTHPAAAGPTGS